MYFDQEGETRDINELRTLQEERLRDLVHYVYYNSPFYRKRFDKTGINPSDIKTLSDLEKIPFTTKDDLRDNYPFGMLAVPRDNIIRIHASSGTTGKPTVVAYTQKDIQTWAGLMARTLTSTGLTPKDTIQLIYNYAFFTGGLGFHYGAEKVGAAVIPAGIGNSHKQLMTMKDFGVTFFSSTPSYAMYLAEYAEKNDIDVKSFGLKNAVFGAEPWSDGLRKRIESAFGINAYDNYGLSELCGPGVASECREKNGLHVWSDHFLVEIINPETGKVLEPGEVGELVFTTLTKEGMPLLRYRTRDISRIYPGDCPCGRTFPRIARLMGRSDDMLIVRGINIFPSQIEHIIMKIPGVSDNYQIVVDRKGMLDDLKIIVEVTENIFQGEAEDLISFKEMIESSLKDSLEVRVKVNLVEVGTIPRSQGKANRILDLRKEI